VVYPSWPITRASAAARLRLPLKASRRAASRPRLLLPGPGPEVLQESHGSRTDVQSVYEGHIGRNRARSASRTQSGSGQLGAIHDQSAGKVPGHNPLPSLPYQLLGSAFEVLGIEPRASFRTLPALTARDTARLIAVGDTKTFGQFA